MKLHHFNRIQLSILVENQSSLKKELKLFQRELNSNDVSIIQNKINQNTYLIKTLQESYNKIKPKKQTTFCY